MFYWTKVACSVKVWTSPPPRRYGRLSCRDKNWPEAIKREHTDSALPSVSTSESPANTVCDATDTRQWKVVIKKDIFIYIRPQIGGQNLNHGFFFFFFPSSSSSSALLLEAVGNRHAHIRKGRVGDKFSLKVEQLTNWCLLLLFEQTPFSDVRRMTAHGRVKGVNVQTCQRSARLRAHKPNCPRGGGGWRGASFYLGVAVLNSDISLLPKPPVVSVSPEKRNCAAELCRCCVTALVDPY